MRTSGQKYPKAVSAIFLFVLCCSLLLASASAAPRKKRPVRRPAALQSFEDFYDETPRSEAVGAGRSFFSRANWFRLRNYFLRKKNRFFNTSPTTTTFSSNVLTPSSLLPPSARVNAEELGSKIDDKLAVSEDVTQAYDQLQRPVNRLRIGGIQASATNINKNRQKLRKMPASSNIRISQQRNRQNNNQNNNKRPMNTQRVGFNGLRNLAPVIIQS